jgi:hypothetical protein
MLWTSDLSLAHYLIIRERIHVDDGVAPRASNATGKAAKTEESGMVFFPFTRTDSTTSPVKIL